MEIPSRSDAASDQFALVELFTSLGRELTNHRSVDQVLATISRRAFEAVPSADHTAISRGRKDQFETVAATSDVPLQVDKLQYALRSGPCVDAILNNTVFRVADLATDTGWPEFGRQAVEQFGIHSMLSVRMYLEEDDLLAGLNFYAADPGAFDQSDQVTATLLATHGALALSLARRQDKVDNLERALHTSRRIGTAIGVLMATHKVTEDQAFDLLRIASQANHRKVAEIADEVVVSGVLNLPQAPDQRRRR